MSSADLPEPPAPALLVIDRLAGTPDALVDLLLEQSGVGVLVADRRCRILRMNAALQHMIGRPATVGLPALHLFAVPERQALADRLQQALRGADFGQPIAATLDPEGGEAIPAVELSLLPLREADGSISGILLRLVDVSVQKRLEVQLAQSQKLHAVGQLAAGIAHDFNNLLMAVLGAAEAIACRPALDAETLADVAEIRGSAGRGANLVRQLLAFGRQQSLVPRVIPVNAAITALSALLTRLLGSHIRLVLDLDTPGQMARVDPTQLDQVIINLAVNARDAMGQGGTLTLRTGHITLHRPLVRGPETIPPGRYVMIEVQDTGTGIEPALLPRIFDPFFSTKRDRGGTGLGLSTVHGIIRQSGGFLGVESEIGLGTRLRVYLPRHDDPAPETPACGVAAIVAQGTQAADAPVRRVLLVDDEAAVRRLTERALIQAGWQVLSADSAEAALELVGAAGPSGPPLSLVISDVMMPGIDGPALVARLRAAAPSLPAILVSGYAEERLRNRLAMQGTLFLAKPYRLAELLDAAETILLPD